MRRLLGLAIRYALGPALALVLALVATPGVARAEVSEAPARPDEQFDVMNLLSKNHLHDLHEEDWNAYGQITGIASYKLPFSAAYTKPGFSLSTDKEVSWTTSVTAYLGLRLWQGAELYVVPEMIAEVPLSGLRGLGGAIQNFELQKQGQATPTVYRSRAYLTQTIPLGGERLDLDSQPQQLAGHRKTSRRLELVVGNYSIGDFFDKNTYSGPLRQQFFNMSFLTYAAYDFVADARGFSWGATAALFWDDWDMHVGRLAPPLNPNSLPLTFQLDQFYGDQIEIEHNHKLFGRPGAVRVLGYHNRESMGRFDDAVAAFRKDPTQNAANCGNLYNYGSPSTDAPDLCFVRRPNDKYGIGINLEQEIAPDIGVFFRGMYSDGQTEVYAFTSTDRSIAFGVLGKGTVWRRPRDVTGIGAGFNWISQQHADYLKAGGVEGFVGDGNITAATESVLDVFYSVNVISSVWLSGDYQHIVNPAFNSDRGPVDIFGARFHAEF